MARPTKIGALAILERRKNVAARYVRGEPQWQIARAFEVDDAQICRDLKAIREEWRQAAIAEIGIHKARELAKVDEAEREAWAAWRKSQENAEILKARMSGGESTTEKVSKGQAGDPRFLDLVLKCVEKRCQILGILKMPGTIGTSITVVGGVDMNVIVGQAPGITHDVNGS